MLMKKTTTFLKMLFVMCFLLGTAGTYAAVKLEVTYMKAGSSPDFLPQETTEEFTDEYGSGKAYPINPGKMPNGFGGQAVIPYGTPHSNEFTFSFTGLEPNATVTYGFDEENDAANPDNAKATSFDLENAALGFGEHQADADGNLTFTSTVTVLADYPTTCMKNEEGYRLYTYFQIGGQRTHSLFFIFRPDEMLLPEILISEGSSFENEQLAIKSIDEDRQIATDYGVNKVGGLNYGGNVFNWFEAGEIPYDKDMPAEVGTFAVTFENNESETMIIAREESYMFPLSPLFCLVAEGDGITMATDSSYVEFAPGTTEAEITVYIKNGYDLSKITPDQYNLVGFNYGRKCGDSRNNRIRIVFIPTLPADYWSFDLTGLTQVEGEGNENKYTHAFGTVKENRLKNTSKSLSINAMQVTGSALTFTSDAGANSIFWLDTTYNKFPNVTSGEAGSWTIALSEKGSVKVSNIYLKVDPSKITSDETQWGQEITETWTLKSNDGTEADPKYINKTVTLTITPQHTVNMSITSEDERFTAGNPTKLAFGDVEHGQTATAATFDINLKYMTEGETITMSLQDDFAFNTTLTVGETPLEGTNGTYTYTADATGAATISVTFEVKTDYSALEMLEYGSGYEALLTIRNSDYSIQQNVTIGLNMTLPEGYTALEVTDERGNKLDVEGAEKTYALNATTTLSKIQYVNIPVRMLMAGYPTTDIVLTAPENSNFAVDGTLTLVEGTESYKMTTGEDGKGNASFAFVLKETVNVEETFTAGETYPETWTLMIGAESYTFNLSLKVDFEPVLTLTSESDKFTGPVVQWGMTMYDIDFGEVTYGQTDKVTVNVKGDYLPAGETLYIYSDSEYEFYTTEATGMVKGEYSAGWWGSFPAWTVTVPENGTVDVSWTVSIKTDYDYATMEEFLEWMSEDGVTCSIPYSVVCEGTQTTVNVDFTPKKGGGETGLDENTLNGVYFDGRMVMNPQGMQLSIYNTVGQLVATGVENIDLTACPNGVYVIKAANGNMKIVK